MFQHIYQGELLTTGSAFLASGNQVIGEILFAKYTENYPKYLGSDLPQDTEEEYYIEVTKSRVFNYTITKDREDWFILIGAIYSLVVERVNAEE